MKPVDERLIAEIKQRHRARWFWIKYQLSSERMLESFVRINATEWHPDLSKAERDKINKQVKDKINRIKKKQDLTAAYAPEVMLMQGSTGPIKQRRAVLEREMEELAEQLPVYAWAIAIPGIAALSLATIVAEAGDLARYPNPAKLRRRLGLAPFDGYAGSTWMREAWRPRALDKQEWITLGYSPNRYARMAQIAKSIFFKQWKGKGKSEDGVGKPTGPYGKIYADRRKHTEITRPEWTPGHHQSDAMRVMMQQFINDLWGAWNEKERPAPTAHPKARRAKKKSKVLA